MAILPVDNSLDNYFAAIEHVPETLVQGFFITDIAQLFQAFFVSVFFHEIERDGEFQGICYCGDLALYEDAAVYFTGFGVVPVEH